MMNYEELKNLVMEILAEADLMELISMGCPLDEYSPEAKYIARYMNYMISNEELTVEGLTENIQEAFEVYFMSQFEMDICRQIAKCILEEMKA